MGVKELLLGSLDEARCCSTGNCWSVSLTLGWLETHINLQNWVCFSQCSMHVAVPYAAAQPATGQPTSYVLNSKLDLLEIWLVSLT